MPSIKTCKNGHNYDESIYKTCPFCPGLSATTDLDQTMLDFKKTQLFTDGNNSQFDKTIMNEDTSHFKTTSPNIGVPGASENTKQHPFSRTSIVMPNEAEKTIIQTNSKRKLVGWLVSFSNDEFGEDFKIYVGKNKIGSSPENDIIINDNSISGDHTTILYRDQEFLIKDNFSTNGTRINGQITDEGKLKDGDVLKLGNTTLKFKTVF